jgi:hypothetical protein
VSEPAGSRAARCPASGSCPCRSSALALSSGRHPSRRRPVAVRSCCQFTVPALCGRCEGVDRPGLGPVGPGAVLRLRSGWMSGEADEFSLPGGGGFDGGQVGGRGRGRFPVQPGGSPLGSPRGPGPRTSAETPQRPAPTSASAAHRTGADCGRAGAGGRARRGECAGAQSSGAGDRLAGSPGHPHVGASLRQRDRGADGARCQGLRRVRPSPGRIGQPARRNPCLLPGRAGARPRLARWRHPGLGGSPGQRRGGSRCRGPGRGGRPLSGRWRPQIRLRDRRAADRALARGPRLGLGGTARGRSPKASCCTRR